jgi:hypothetical protein
MSVFRTAAATWGYQSVSRGTNGAPFDVANYQTGASGGAWRPSPVDTPQWRAQIIAPEVLDDPVQPRFGAEDVAQAEIVVAGAVAIEVDVALGGVVIKTVAGAISTEIDVALSGAIKKDVLGAVAVEVDEAIIGIIEGGFVAPPGEGKVRLYRNPATFGQGFDLRVNGLAVAVGTSGDIDVSRHEAELYRVMYFAGDRLYSYEPYS